MTNSTSPCSVCGAELKHQRITYTQIIDDAVYIVADVDADVCSQCGEQYLTPEMVDQIQELIESGQVQETRLVPVYRIPQIAP